MARRNYRRRTEERSALGEARHWTDAGRVHVDSRLVIPPLSLSLLFPSCVLVTAPAIKNSEAVLPGASLPARLPSAVQQLAGCAENEPILIDLLQRLRRHSDVWCGKQRIDAAVVCQMTGYQAA